MKILKLRGRNIRSLYGDFELDLESPPFDRLGLFAITGPTGAGKSTLLDVISLALYGICPRLENQKKNAALINKLSGSDPRTAVSRGASDGFAEVVFESFGHRYRARWEVHPSGKKSIGGFAKPVREFTDDLSGNAIADQSREFDNQMALRTRLNYNQFSRSVLLAQGDFAAFLKAPPDERSALLEAITGLGIYTHLSVEAHRQGVKVETDIRNISSDLERLSPLSEKEFADMAVRIRAAENIRTKLALTETRIHNDLRRHDQEQELLARQAQAEAKDVLIRKKSDAAAPRRKLLEQAVKAAGIRAEIEFFQKTADILQKKIKDRTAAALSHAALSEAYAVSLKEFGHALKRLEDEKRRQEAIQTDLETARRLDIRIRQADRILEEKKAVLSEISGLSAKAEADLKALRTKEDTLSKKLSLENRWLNDRVATAPLAKEWQYCQSLLLQFETVHGQLSGLETATRRLLSDINRNRTRIGTLTRKEQDAQDEMRQAGSFLEEKRRLLDQIEQTHPHDHLLKKISAFTNAGFLADQIIRLCSRLKILAKQISAHQSEGQISEETRRCAISEQELLAKERGDIRIRLDEAGKSLELIRSALSCDELRSKLQTGKPCMVCGSVSHPYVDGNLPQQSVQILEEARVSELEARRQRISSALSEKAAQIARTEEIIKSLHLRIGQDRDEYSQTADDLKSLHHQLADLLKQSAFRNIPESADSEADIFLWQAFKTGLASEVVAAEDIRNQKKDLSDHILQTGGRYEKLRNTCQEITADLTAVRHQQSHAEKDLKDAESASAQAMQRQMTLTEALAVIFDPVSAAWEPECRKDPAGFRKFYEREAAAFRQRKENQIGIHAELTGLKPGLSESQAAAANLRDRVSEAKRVADESAAESDSLKMQRKTVLNGKTVADAVQELKQTLDRLEKASEQSRTAEKDTAVRLKQAESAACHAQTDCDAARTDHEDAERNLKQALQRQGLDLTEAQELNRNGDALIRSLQKELTDLENDIARSAEALRQRKNDLETFRNTSGTPASSMQDLQKELTQISEDKKQAEDNLTELLAVRRDADIRRNDALRLGKQLDDVKEKGKWRQVLKEVIGHHAGDKFRKFAQTITLKHLVQIANDQLMQLAPRYRLTLPEGSQNLDIAVIDRDQASEIRQISTLSGGETFLASLALSLALSKLSSRQTGIKTLFIDEGFGLLDTDTLDSALATLEMIRSEGRLIGLISHVPVIQERIACQVRVISEGAGRSRLEVHGS